MAEEFPILFSNETIVVYKLNDMARLDDAFVGRLDWPAGRKGQIFTSGGPIAEELLLNPRFTYSREFTFSFNFSANKEWLKGEAPTVSAVKPAGTPSLDKHRPLYIKIKRRIFNQLSWYKEDPEGDKREVEAFERKVNAYKVGYWEKDGTAAGIVALRKWKDYSQQPVDWISWLLVEEALSREERAATHAYMGAWLKENAGPKVECLVQSFNIRSLKFFIKLGFKPVALHVYKDGA